jgi:hypothetical protein
MLDEKFVLVAAAIQIAGSVPYIRATLAGRTQPNRVTWALWALAPLIVFAAQLGQDVGLTALMTLLVGLYPLVVVAASFRDPGAYWAVSRGDLACGLLSLVALAGWAVTRDGLVAIALGVLADLAAGLPTLRKAYRHPGTEEPTVFGATAVGQLITLLCLPRPVLFAAAAFPLLVCTISSTLFVLVRFPTFGPGRHGNRGQNGDAGPADGARVHPVAPRSTPVPPADSVRAVGVPNVTMPPDATQGD